MTTDPVLEQLDLDFLRHATMGLDGIPIIASWQVGRDEVWLPGLGMRPPSIIAHPFLVDQIAATDVLDRLRRVQATIEGLIASRAAAALRKLDDAINSYDWLDHTDIDELLEDDPA